MYLPELGAPATPYQVLCRPGRQVCDDCATLHIETEIQVDAVAFWGSGWHFGCLPRPSTRLYQELYVTVSVWWHMLFSWTGSWGRGDSTTALSWCIYSGFSISKGIVGLASKRSQYSNELHGPMLLKAPQITHMFGALNFMAHYYVLACEVIQTYQWFVQADADYCHEEAPIQNSPMHSTQMQLPSKAIGT